MGKVSRGPGHNKAVLNNLKVERNSMPYNQESRKDKIINHNTTKQAHVNTVEPANHLKDSQ